MLNVNNTVHAEILVLVVAGSPFAAPGVSAAEVASAQVIAHGDACLVIYAEGGRADFYYRSNIGGWGYRHSYRTPVPPHDAHDAQRALWHGIHRMWKRHGVGGMRQLASTAV